jgi:hypothetical protein
MNLKNCRSYCTLINPPIALQIPIVSKRGKVFRLIIVVFTPDDLGYYQDDRAINPPFFLQILAMVWGNN